MKDILTEVMNLFEKDDQKEFEHYISKRGRKSERKDIQLLHLIQKYPEEKGKFYQQRIYKKENNDGYLALRKRLISDLVEFVSVKQMGKHQNADLYGLSLLIFGRYLAQNNLPQLAIRFLDKAEQDAEKNDLYQVLNSIYNVKLEIFEMIEGGDLQDLIDRRNENRKRMDEEENANVACALVKRNLRRTIAEGELVSPHDIVDSVLKKYGFTETIYTNPKIVLQLCEIMRKAILPRKKFHEFLPFARSMNLRMLKIELKPNQQFYRLQLNYILCHTLYRAKHFEEAMERTRQLREDTLNANKSVKRKILFKVELLFAAVASLVERPKAGIEVLEKLIVSPEAKNEQVLLLDAKLNLSVYHFQAEDFKASHRAMLDIYHSDNWCIKVMGQEWTIKKILIEITIGYERGLVDLVDSRTKFCQKKFKQILNQPQYARVVIFLKLVQKMNNNPERISSPEFRNQLVGSFEIIPLEQEDMQAVSFYAWMKAKALKVSYYKMLREYFGLE